MSEHPVGVLFVCLGNICRSPSAQGIFEHHCRARGVAELVHVDSCGTAAFNLGNPPDARAIAAAARRGYDISRQRARQISPEDFLHFHYVVAMDRLNLMNIRALAPPDYPGEVELLMHYQADAASAQVADPFYHDGAFDALIPVLESATRSLLHYVCDRHQLDRSRP